MNHQRGAFSQPRLRHHSWAAALRAAITRPPLPCPGWLPRPMKSRRARLPNHRVLQGDDAEANPAAVSGRGVRRVNLRIGRRGPGDSYVNGITLNDTIDNPVTVTGTITAPSGTALLQLGGPIDGGGTERSMAGPSATPARSVARPDPAFNLART